jgi:glycosyltransferase involved in cell wall biosynthesis
MRILYIHQHFSTRAGSSGTRSYEMAQRLVREGHEVTMVCGSYSAGQTGLDTAFDRGKRTGLVDGISVVEYELQYSNKDGFAKRVVTFLRFVVGSTKVAMTAPYDLVFATSTPLTVGIPGVLARWLRRKPFVFEVRDLWPELPRAMGVITNPVVLWALGVLEWASYRSARQCIALSPGIRQGIERRGVAADRIALVPNGCDLDIFGDPDLVAWRPESIGADDLLALFSGTHGQANGLDAVLDAAAVLKSRGAAGIKLLLVGDGKCKPELVARATREGLDNVIFHEPLPKARLAALMASADLGIQCLANVPAFYYGTSPNKFFDYIAAGRPVLNNYPGWLAGMITANECGFAVPPDDPVKFADALQQADGDRESLKRMGSNARELARREFDRNDLSGKWVKAVTSAAG